MFIGLLRLGVLISISLIIIIACYKGLIRLWINNKMLYNIMLIFFLWLPVCIVAFFFIWSFLTFNSTVNRNAGVKTLKELNAMQREFLNRNKRYPLTFKELGCDENRPYDCIRSKYTFYLNNDRRYLPGYGPVEFPSDLKREPNIIYAVGFIALPEDYPLPDILKIDLGGCVELIRSEMWWFEFKGCK